MPVFDFSNTTEEKKACECTYTTFQSNENTASAKYPILVLDNTAKQWKYHSCGVFTNQTKRTAFEFTQEDGTVCADILRVDARFVNLLRWLGENHINVRLSGENTPDGYAVYKIREIAFGGGKKLSAEDGFLQFMMERLFASSAPSEEAVDEEQEEDGDDMKLTSIQSITDFMTCAGRTMPDNIRLWARRNLAVARSNEVSPEERRHAQRALSIMMNIQWKNNYFEAIDPKEARRILDEELYGMERVKQRIIETIIQINRTHTLASQEALKYWLPVDWYNGGMEHTTLHLLYSRFWHKFLYDQGIVPTKEPYQRRTSHGMILGENGEKMSKSRGNVVNPDDIVQAYGADTLRTYEMFIGAFDLSASWSEDGVKGCRRFLERVWKLQTIMTDEEGYSSDMETKMHQAIKKVSLDFENLKYNTAIAAMMSLINDFYKKNAVTKGEYKTLLTLLNPVAPHITEELWEMIGGEGHVYQTAWPEYDEAKTVESTVEIAVQINGKTRATLSIGKDDAKEDVLAKAKETIADKLEGKNIIKEIYVPGRIVNIVAK